MAIDPKRKQPLLLHLQCKSAPPRSSADTSSPVAAFTYKDKSHGQTGPRITLTSTLLKLTHPHSSFHRAEVHCAYPPHMTSLPPTSIERREEGVPLSLGHEVLKNSPLLSASPPFTNSAGEGWRRQLARVLKGCLCPLYLFIFVFWSQRKLFCFLLLGEMREM